MSKTGKLRTGWTAEMAADFQSFHGSKSYIPYGESYLQPGTMFRIKEFCDDTYVVIERHNDRHVVFSNTDERKITHDGGFDLNHIEIYEVK